MYIVAFFTESGTPKTGLSPKVKIYKVSDNTLVVNDADMTEIGSGFYKYNFTSYDRNESYAILCDSVTLTGAERYVYSGTDVSGDHETLVDVAKMIENRIVRSGDTITIYDDDNSTTWRTYDLSDGGRSQV